jgi:hypothetical protein
VLDYSITFNVCEIIFRSGLLPKKKTIKHFDIDCIHYQYKEYCSFYFFFKMKGLPPKRLTKRAHLQSSALVESFGLVFKMNIAKGFVKRNSF